MSKLQMMAQPSVAQDSCTKMATAGSKGLMKACHNKIAQCTNATYRDGLWTYAVE